MGIIDSGEEPKTVEEISNIPMISTKTWYHMNFDEGVGGISICITIIVMIVFCVIDKFVIIIIYHPTSIFHLYHLVGVFSPLFVVVVFVLLWSIDN